MKKVKPTNQIYSELQQAYDHFNLMLFEGILPECILVLYSKERRIAGYFCAGQFVHLSGRVCDSIAMNPQYFASRRIVEVMQTIVHEMCHAWQYHFGTNKSQRGYHNKEWANKMESLGLMPSSTGKPEGKRTGQRMSDYPISGGQFLAACDTLLTPAYQISWMDRFSVDAQIAGYTSTLAILGINDAEQPQVQTKQPTRTKYICPLCGTKIWGKTDLRIQCVDCDELFIPA